MGDQTLRIRINHFTRDSYVERMMKFFSKKDNFCISNLDLKSKIELEDFIIKKLLYAHSDVANDVYLLNDYSGRCAIINRAINHKSSTVQTIIKDKFSGRKTEYSNVFEIDKDFFEQFVSFFCDEIFIDWDSISEVGELNWNMEILETGKFVWNWFEIQINPSLVNYFTDFELLKKYEHFLDWDLISCDSRLEWTISRINLFKGKIKFSPIFDERLYNDDKIKFVHKCYTNNGQPGGLSMNPNLSSETILEHIKLWDMKYLSSNPVILTDNLFMLHNLPDIDLYGLSQNKGLNFEALRYLKELYATIDKSSVYPKILYNGLEIPWHFYWKYAFENASVDWKIKDIEEFKSILDENSPLGGNNWEGISKNIKRKEVIVNYHREIDFLLLALYNPTIIWDSDLISLLIGSKISLETNEYTKALPDILEKINITNEAIDVHSDYWDTIYTYSFYTRTNDGTEKRFSYSPLWKSLQKNKSINWTSKLLELYNNRQNEI